MSASLVARFLRSARTEAVLGPGSSCRNGSGSHEAPWRWGSGAEGTAQTRRWKAGEDGQDGADALRGGPTPGGYRGVRPRHRTVKGGSARPGPLVPATSA